MIPFDPFIILSYVSVDKLVCQGSGRVKPVVDSKYRVAKRSCLMLMVYSCIKMAELLGHTVEIIFCRSFCLNSI